MSSPTTKFIEAIGKLEEGDLGILRSHAGRELDESLPGFDLFAGLWWPIRKMHKNAPRREAAWLVAKLYAFRPMPNDHGATLARMLRKCEPIKKEEGIRFRAAFDRMLGLPISGIEPALQWSLNRIPSERRKLDWVQLTNDLSRWENESIRLAWAEEYLEARREEPSC